jgi:hypothetical protein
MIAKKMFMKFAPVFDENISLENKIKFFFKEHITFMQENPRLPGFILNEVNRHPERLKKLIKNAEVKNLFTMLMRQHKDELYKYNITEESFPQLMTTIASMSVFPFAARGILEGIFSNMDINFDKYIEDRKEFAADFVIKAITK